MPQILTPGVAAVIEPRLPCVHEPQCPAWDAADHDAAHVVAFHPEQGWSRLCNGVVLFADTGELAPDRHTTDPHRPDCPHRAGAL